MRHVETKQSRRSTFILQVKTKRVIKHDVLKHLAHTTQPDIVKMRDTY